MKSTKSKAVVVGDRTIAQGKSWKTDSLHNYRKKQQEFIKDNYRSFAIKLNRGKDKELIDYIESQENATEFIRQLIKKDMGERG